MSITIELDATSEKWLAEECNSSGHQPGEFVRNILQEHLAVRHAKRLRNKLAPKAAAAGFLTDDDIFRAVS